MTRQALLNVLRRVEAGLPDAGWNLAMDHPGADARAEPALEQVKAWPRPRRCLSRWRSATSGKR
ncbi:hypothetical protein WKI68_42255 [Streptomyces sp. MS1.HAVA.3]|uniref:Uncharacterized protein n=1 Tax=Streptomyces caledonius TaxID=3134107 RepID=A0ABU8UDU4_9ACTN